MLQSMKPELDLHYRHARRENLLMVGENSNPYKTKWINGQLRIFKKLGWRFISIDASADQMGECDLFGRDWTYIERGSLSKIVNPIIKVDTVQELLETMENVSVAVSQYEIEATIVLHLADFVFTTPELIRFKRELSRILNLKTGVWIIAPNLKTIPLEWSVVYIQTTIFTPPSPDNLGEYEEWEKQAQTGIERFEFEEDEAIFIFRGRSEGARGLVLRRCIS